MYSLVLLTVSCYGYGGYGKSVIEIVDNCGGDNFRKERSTSIMIMI